MKKKVLAVLLAGCMTMALAACGGGADESSSRTQMQERKHLLRTPALLRLLRREN